MQDQENEEMILMMMMMMFMFIGVGLLIYFMFREKDCSDIDSDDDDYVVGALTYKNDEDDKQKCVPKTCGTGYDTLPVNGSCVVSSTPSYETETETETEDEEKDCDDIDSDDDDYVVGALTYKIDPDNESNCIPEVCGEGYHATPVNGSCVASTLVGDPSSSTITKRTLTPLSPTPSSPTPSSPSRTPPCAATNSCSERENAGGPSRGGARRRSLGD